MSRLLPVLLGVWAACALPAAAGEPAALWFPVGERFVYRLYWGMVPVGEAHFWSEWVEQDGKRLIALRATAKSNSVLERIYPVDDTIESLVDPVTFLPLRYEQRLRGGRSVSHDRIVFNHAECTAVWTSPVRRRQKEIAIDRDTRDVLSLAYAMRARGMAPGQVERFRVVVDYKLYDLSVEAIAEQSVGTDGLGAVRSLKVEPTARFGEVFVRGGRVFMWFSADSRRICTRMTGKAPVASVKALLAAVEGPDAASWPPAEVRGEPPAP
jgi:hypothetical protein